MDYEVHGESTRDSEAGILPDQTLLAAMRKYNEELADAVVLVGGEGLHPSSNGVRVRFSGTDRTVINGPFTEFNELISGFWIFDVNSIHEAIEWVKRAPNPHAGESEIEIRQIFEADDFGDEFTPELRAREEHVRSRVESTGKDSHK